MPGLFSEHSAEYNTLRNAVRNLVKKEITYPSGSYEANCNDDECQGFACSNPGRSYVGPSYSDVSSAASRQEKEVNDLITRIKNAQNLTPTEQKHITENLLVPLYERQVRIFSRAHNTLRRDFFLNKCNTYEGELNKISPEQNKACCAVS